TRPPPPPAARSRRGGDTPISAGSRPTTGAPTASRPAGPCAATDPGASVADTHPLLLSVRPLHQHEAARLAGRHHRSPEGVAEHDELPALQQLPGRRIA